MNSIRLTLDYDIKPFSCGEDELDTDLNEFLFDAYKKSIPFYEKNEFIHLSDEDDTKSPTRLMYYDLTMLT